MRSKIAPDLIADAGAGLFRGRRLGLPRGHALGQDYAPPRMNGYGMRTSLSAVIPGRRASVEPGIHSHRLWLWIPGLRLAAHPGMTAERDVCMR
jgi:hypothetical protein